jgi:hypothetical protein
MHAYTKQYREENDNTTSALSMIHTIQYPAPTLLKPKQSPRHPDLDGNTETSLPCGYQGHSTGRLSRSTFVYGPLAGLDRAV